MVLINGKELETFNNFETLDYGARMYDGQLGRWHVIDNKVEKYHAWLPYNYVLNNPLKYIDPDGQDVELIIGKPYTKDGSKYFKNEHVLGNL